MSSLAIALRVQKRDGIVVIIVVATCIVVTIVVVAVVVVLLLCHLSSASFRLA